MIKLKRRIMVDCGCGRDTLSHDEGPKTIPSRIMGERGPLGSRHVRVDYQSKGKPPTGHVSKGHYGHLEDV